MTEKRPRKDGKAKPVQLGWNDWSQSVSPPAKKAAPAAPAVAEKRDWSKLEFTKTAPRRESVENQSDVSVVAAADANVTQSVAVATDSKSPATSRANSELAEPTVLSIGQLNKMIRRQLENEFSVIWLRGEISNFKAHPSGHFYFSLKDKDAQVSAVMFRGYNSQLRFKPEDGMEVIVRGKITVYEPRGNYQVMCETMEPVGAGALQKAFEQLKRKLQDEGLFDQARKRAIPSAPKHIAIVTSPSGAAIRDMLNVLSRRYRAARITLVPASVQGTRATSEIVNAIALANRLQDVDVLIVGRGGGSIEDMWSFNEEAVARAIVASRVPVIFVADLRAPTPSAAAELVAKNAGELVSVIQRIERTISGAMLARIAKARDSIRTAQRLLVDPRRRIEDAVLRCDDLVERLERAVLESVDRTRMTLELIDERLAVRLRRRLESARAKFVRAASMLDGLSPLRVLDRGYALVTYEGRALTKAQDIEAGKTIAIRLAQGQLEANVLKITKSEKPEKQ
jgi:exodeoxyribonuclease VII large subunit